MLGRRNLWIETLEQVKEKGGRAKSRCQDGSSREKELSWRDRRRRGGLTFSIARNLDP